MSRKTSDELELRIVADYETGMSVPEIIGKHGGVSRSCAYLILRRRGVEIRTGGAPFRDGRSSRDGYVLVNVRHSGDDLAHQMSNGLAQGRYVPEHRLVMARHLGRALEKHEQVHHINGDRADNRIENLQLRQGAHGKGSTYRCRACGSTDVEAVQLA